MRSAYKLRTLGLLKRCIINRQRLYPMVPYFREKEADWQMPKDGLLLTCRYQDKICTVVHAESVSTVRGSPRGSLGIFEWELDVIDVNGNMMRATVDHLFASGFRCVIGI